MAQQQRRSRGDEGGPAHPGEHRLERGGHGQRQNEQESAGAGREEGRGIPVGEEPDHHRDDETEENAGGRRLGRAAGRRPSGGRAEQDQSETEEGPEQQVRQATAEDTDRDGLLQGHVQRGLPLRIVHARLQTIVPTGQALIDALPGNNLLPDRVRGADPWRVPVRNFFQPRRVGLKHPPGRGNPGKIGTEG